MHDQGGRPVNDFLGQLNLTVQERRIVMGIFAVVILVLNYLFVWPRFGEWGRINKQLEPDAANDDQQ